MRVGLWVVMLLVWAVAPPARANGDCRHASFERAMLASFTAPWHDPPCLAPGHSPRTFNTLSEAPSGGRPNVFAEGMRRESAALSPAQAVEALAPGFGLGSLDLGSAKSGAAMAQEGDRAVYAWVTKMTEVGGTRHEIKRFAAGIHMPGGQILQLFVLGAMGLVLLRRQWSMG